MVYFNFLINWNGRLVFSLADPGEGVVRCIVPSPIMKEISCFDLLNFPGILLTRVNFWWRKMSRRPLRKSESTPGFQNHVLQSYSICVSEKQLSREIFHFRRMWKP